MPECAKQYTAWAGTVLHCTGEHLQGNPFRDGGLVHQARLGGVPWTWYDSESDKEQPRA